MNTNVLVANLKASVAKYVLEVQEHGFGPFVDVVRTARILGKAEQMLELSRVWRELGDFEAADHASCEATWIIEHYLSPEEVVVACCFIPQPKAGHIGHTTLLPLLTSQEEQRKLRREVRNMLRASGAPLSQPVRFAVLNLAHEAMLQAKVIADDLDS
jgi:hypothetical protein